jgi:hypothetical protein
MRLKSGKRMDSFWFGNEIEARVRGRAKRIQGGFFLVPNLDVETQ